MTEWTAESVDSRISLDTVFKENGNDVNWISVFQLHNWDNRAFENSQPARSAEGRKSLYAENRAPGCFLKSLILVKQDAEYSDVAFSLYVTSPWVPVSGTWPSSEKHLNRSFVVACELMVCTSDIMPKSLLQTNKLHLFFLRIKLSFLFVKDTILLKWPMDSYNFAYRRSGWNI